MENGGEWKGGVFDRGMGAGAERLRSFATLRMTAGKRGKIERGNWKTVIWKCGGDLDRST